MRLTTKFSTFVTLLTGLAIFVTLLGCSFSFYRAIEQKVAERVESVAAVIDTRLVSQPPSALAVQLDELMVPIDIVRVVVKQGEHILLDHARSGSYRPAGSSDLHRERLVPSIKNPGTSILLIYQDPMDNYFHSVITTVPLTFAVGFMVIIIFLAIRWQYAGSAVSWRGRSCWRAGPLGSSTASAASGCGAASMSGPPGPVARSICC